MDNDDKNDSGTTTTTTTTTSSGDCCEMLMDASQSAEQREEDTDGIITCRDLTRILKEAEKQREQQQQQQSFQAAVAATTAASVAEEQQQQEEGDEEEGDRKCAAISQKAIALANLRIVREADEAAKSRISGNQTVTVPVATAAAVAPSLEEEADIEDSVIAEVLANLRAANQATDAAAKIRNRIPPSGNSIASLGSMPGAFDVAGIGRDNSDSTTNSNDIDIEAPPLTATVSIRSIGSMSHLSTDNLVEAELVQEEAPVEAKPLRPSRSRAPLAALGAFIIMVLVGVIIFLVVIVPQQNSSGAAVEEGTLGVVIAAAMPRQPILERIQQRGKLRCGSAGEINNMFASIDQMVKDLGAKDAPIFSNNFIERMCNSMAAAVLGEGAESEMVSVNESSKFEALASGRIDLLTTRNSLSMTQDVYEEGAGEGIAYTVPWLYSGVAFTGVHDMVKCADNDIDVFGNCSQLVICVNQESSFLDKLRAGVPQSQLVVEDSYMLLFQAFFKGECNVLATEAPSLTASIIKALGYNGTDLVTGDREYSLEMWSPKTLDSDPEWSNFLNAAMMALLAAEEAGITQEMANRMGQTQLFGEKHKNMFVDVVHANGNFGEIYTFPVVRNGSNQPNNGSTGLLVTPPLGRIQQHSVAPAPIPGGIIEKVLDRGVLHCGIRGGRPGFASSITSNISNNSWSGIDTDYCSTLAAALFQGKSENVIFIDVTTSKGWTELLEQGDVDVVAGAVWTLENAFRGFSFTQPYFYGPINSSRFDENLCLASIDTDGQWSGFVYWAAQSLVLAEERGITRRESTDMPLVLSFGRGFERMFRDAIFASGNYGEIYERNLATMLPRGGRNRLNIWEDHGPLRYLPPGFAL